MIIKPFAPSDYEELLQWYSDWEEPPPALELLPKTGFVIQNICAGFLYMTDARLGILDCFISNPSSPKEKRTEAINALADNLLACAKFYGCRAVMASSNILSIKQRCEDLGFVYKGETSLYIKEL